MYTYSLYFFTISILFIYFFSSKFNPISHRGMATIFCCPRFRFPLYSGKQTPGGCLAGNDGKHDIELTIGTKFVVLSLMILSLKYTKTHPHTHYHTHSIIQQVTQGHRFASPPHPCLGLYTNIFEGIKILSLKGKSQDTISIISIVKGTVS